MTLNRRPPASQKRSDPKKPSAVKPPQLGGEPQRSMPDNRINALAQTESLATHLSNSNFQIAQRQRMVRQLGQAQGNRYIQRLMDQIQRWADPEAAARIIDIIDTATPQALEALVNSFETGVNGQGVVLNLPNQTNITIPLADATELRQRATKRLSERLMEDVAAIVLPLAAGIDTATDSQKRRSSMLDMYSKTAPLLPRIASLRPGNERWKHPNPAVQDALLAALQLQVMFQAEAYFTSSTDQEAAGGAHYDAYTTMKGGKDANWCGMFVSTNYLHASFDSELKNGFRHVKNVIDYFTYVYHRYPDRVRKWIYVDEAWQELRAYHEGRAALRQWVDASGIAAEEELDIQAGDIVLLDNDEDGQPNHIVMVHTWNPTTKMLFTIGGNDGGYQVNQKGTRSEPAEDESTMAPRDQAEQALDQPLRRGDKTTHVGIKAIDLGTEAGKVRVFGIGRPSIVDFEDHTYHTENPKKPPVDVPGN